MSFHTLARPSLVETPREGLRQVPGEVLPGNHETTHGRFGLYDVGKIDRVAESETGLSERQRALQVDRREPCGADLLEQPGIRGGSL